MAHSHMGPEGPKGPWAQSEATPSVHQSSTLCGLSPSVPSVHQSPQSISPSAMATVWCSLGLLTLIPRANRSDQPSVTFRMHHYQHRPAPKGCLIYTINPLTCEAGSGMCNCYLYYCLISVSILAQDSFLMAPKHRTNVAKKAKAKKPSRMKRAKVAPTAKPPDGPPLVDPHQAPSSSSNTPPGSKLLHQATLSCFHPKVVPPVSFHQPLCAELYGLEVHCLYGDNLF